MNTVAKILIVVNLVLAGAFLASAANFLGQQDHWKLRHDNVVKDMQAQIDAKQAALDKEIQDKAQMTAQAQDQVKRIGELESANDTLRTRLDFQIEAYSQTANSLTQATAALEAAQATIQSNRDLIDQLQQERASLAEQKRAALEAKEAAVRNLAEKEIQFENLMAQKQALESRVESLQNDLRSAQLTAETAVSRLGGAGEGDIPMDQPAHAGQILSVDNMANVAIISLGSEDGVRPGFRYIVSRGSDYVGTIEITDVQARKAAGRSIKSQQKMALQRGDRVMSR